jgi:hypothetical protein
MIKFAMAIIAAVAAIGLAVPANADPADHQFINTLTAKGITGDRDQLIAEGHQACDTYGAGPAHLGLVYQMLGQGLSRDQVANVILAGLHAYCPDKAPV